MKEEEFVCGVIEGIVDFDKNLIFVIFFGLRFVEIVEEMGVKVVYEVFVDRVYNFDGIFVLCLKFGVVIEDKEEIVECVILMVKDGGVRVINGEWVELKVDIICFYGDNLKVVEIVVYIRKVLEEEGVKIVLMKEIIC